MLEALKLVIPYARQPVFPKILSLIIVFKLIFDLQGIYFLLIKNFDSNKQFVESTSCILEPKYRILQPLKFGGRPELQVLVISVFKPLTCILWRIFGLLWCIQKAKISHKIITAHKATLIPNFGKILLWQAHYSGSLLGLSASLISFFTYELKAHECSFQKIPLEFISDQSVKTYCYMKQDFSRIIHI